MTLEENVADRAKNFLDVVKPDWFRLVPLTPGAVEMLGCAPCLLDHVFKDEAKGYQAFANPGYYWADQRYPGEIYNMAGAFSDESALPFWRNEIASRLAAWSPSATVTQERVQA